MSLVKYRLREVAADFGVSTKEVSQILEQYFEKPKSNTQVLTAEELNVVFDKLTQKNQIKSLEPLKGLKHLNNVFMDYNAGISSVSALANCPKLIQVNVYGTKVTQVGALTSQSIIVNYNPTQ